MIERCRELDSSIADYTDMPGRALFAVSREEIKLDIRVPVSSGKTIEHHVADEIKRNAQRRECCRMFDHRKMEFLFFFVSKWRNFSKDIDLSVCKKVKRTF